MIVAVSEATSGSGSWCWNVKRHRHHRCETVASSEHACLSRGDAMQAAEEFVAAEQTWDRSNSETAS